MSLSSIASPISSSLDIKCRPQIAGLKTEEALTKVPVKYANFAFSPDLASELPEYTVINNYAIKLVDDHPSHPRVFSSFLTKSKMDAFYYAAEVLINWPSRTDLLLG